MTQKLKLDQIKNAGLPETMRYWATEEKKNENLTIASFLEQGADAIDELSLALMSDNKTAQQALKRLTNYALSLRGMPNDKEDIEADAEIIKRAIQTTKSLPTSATLEMKVVGMETWDAKMKEGQQHWLDMMGFVYEAMIQEAATKS